MTSTWIAQSARNYQSENVRIPDSVSLLEHDVRYPDKRPSREQTAEFPDARRPSLRSLRVGGVRDLQPSASSIEKSGPRHGPTESDAGNILVRQSGNISS